LFWRLALKFKSTFVGSGYSMVFSGHGRLPAYSPSRQVVSGKILDQAVGVNR